MWLYSTNRHFIVKFAAQEGHKGKGYVFSECATMMSNVRPIQNRLMIGSSLRFNLNDGIFYSDRKQSHVVYCSYQYPNHIVTCYCISELKV